LRFSRICPILSLLSLNNTASTSSGWLKDESLEASDNPPGPDVIAQETVDDLEAALEQGTNEGMDLGSLLDV
jgi:hypothetical protein